MTAVPGAPPMYQAWLAAADAIGSDAELRRGFAAMRMASSGAAPLPEDIWTAMRDRAAVTVWEGYGLTEASPVVASTLATGRAKPNCIGGPLPGMELELRDTATTESGADDDSDPDDHLEGPGRDLGPRAEPVRRVLARRRRRARTPTAGSAPATSPTATPTATCTSSTGAATSSWSAASTSTRPRWSGCSTPTRRSRRAPSSACPTRAPARRSARSSCVAPGAQLTFEELQAHAAGSLARYKVPTSVHFLPSLPHSLTGKVSRARLRELGLTGQETARSPPRVSRWAPVTETAPAAAAHPRRLPPLRRRRRDARPDRRRGRPGAGSRSTWTPTPSCRPSTATGCRSCCSTAASTPTSPWTSNGCGGT